MLLQSIAIWGDYLNLGNTNRRQRLFEAPDFGALIELRKCSGFEGTGIYGEEPRSHFTRARFKVDLTVANVG